jgi:hypothetical protein
MRCERLIEWPPGSGREANYAPAELHHLRTVIDLLGAVEHHRSGCPAKLQPFDRLGAGS